MLNEDPFDTLTYHGIHQLFTDAFEGQQFTLQVIVYN